MTRRNQHYPPELHERAVRMVAEVTPNYDLQWAAIGAVAQKLGVSTAETVRKWVRQVEVDAGQRADATSEESAEIKRLKREVAELRRANEILKFKSVFFAAERRPGASAFGLELRWSTLETPSGSRAGCTWHSWSPPACPWWRWSGRCSCGRRRSGALRLRTAAVGHPSAASSRSAVARGSSNIGTCPQPFSRTHRVCAGSSLRRRETTGSSTRSRVPKATV